MSIYIYLTCVFPLCIDGAICILRLEAVASSHGTLDETLFDSSLARAMLKVPAAWMVLT